MPLIKIVILNWNGEEHLRRFLPSVITSATGIASVVVVDNSSTDGSVDLLERDYPSVEVLRLDANYGFTGGYNRALDSIEADYFVLLNSDVETPVGWIEPLIELMEREPDVAAVGPKLLSYTNKKMFEYAGGSGGFIDYLGYPFCRGRILGHIECDKGQYDDAREVFWVSGAAFCCRASVFRKLEGFDSDFFAHMEEIDLCWRMQLAGHKIKIVPQSVVYHLGGGTLEAGSPTKVFYNHRNNLAMLYKCAPAGQRWVVAIIRPLLDMVAAFAYLLRGHVRSFYAVFRAYRDFICWHGMLSAKREKIRGGRCSEAGWIYESSILLRYILGVRSFGKMM